MSSSEAFSAEFEGLIKRALAPVEPPSDLAERLEQTLTELTDLAAEELEGWELATMRDPRNWGRQIGAAAIGVTAGTALVALRVRGQHRKRRAASTDPLDYAERTVRAVADEARKLLDR